MIVDFFLVKLTLQLCQSGQSVTCIVSDDTDVFVLLFALGELGGHAGQGTDEALRWFST